MAEDIKPLDNITKQMDATVDTVATTVKDLNTTLTELVDSISDVNDSTEDQQSIIDKVKNELTKQKKELEDHTATLEDSTEEQQKYQEQINETTKTIEAFELQAKESGDAVSTLGDILATKSTAISSISLEPDSSDNDNEDDNSEKSDDKKPFRMEDDQFKEWLQKSDVSTLEKVQANNAKTITEALAETSPVDILAGGITTAMPELAPVFEFFKNSKMIKAIGFSMFRWFKDRKIRKQEEIIRKASIRMFLNKNKNPAEIQKELLKENSSITRGIQSVKEGLGGIVMGKGWKEEQQEAFTEAVTGFSLDDKTIKSMMESGKQEETKNQAEKTLEGQKDYFKNLSSQLEAIDRKSEKAREKGWDRAVNKLEEQKNALIGKDPLTQELVQNSGNLLEFMQGMDEKLLALDPKTNSEQIEELKSIRQSIIDNETKDKDLNKAGLTDDIEIDTDGDRLAKQLGLKGSPAYLETLVNFFTGGKFESILNNMSPAGAAGAAPPLNNMSPAGAAGAAPPDIPDAGAKLENLGSGILDGIRSFIDGLTAVVQSSFQFFQAFIDGIANVISKVAKVISKTFIQLMTGLGQGISALFNAIGKIDPISLAIGAAALGVLTLSLMGMGLALKMMAPFVTAVLGGMAKIFGAIGKVIKVVGQVITNFMTTLVDNIIKLTQVPFMSFLKLAAAFVALGAGLGYFGLTSMIAIPSLLALGVASLGLSKLLEVLPPDQMFAMANGFRVLAAAVKSFGLSSLFLIPAVALLTALSMIPFANKLVDLQLKKAKVDQSASPELFTADTLQVGSVRTIAGEALMSGNDRANQLNAETQVGSGKDMEGKATIATQMINNNETTIIQPKTAVDRGFMDSLISIQQLTV